MAGDDGRLATAHARGRECLGAVQPPTLDALRWVRDPLESVAQAHHRELARDKGVRIVLLVPAVKGELAKVTTEIANLGGNILALGTFMGEDSSNSILTLKVEGVPQDKLAETLRPHVEEILDIRVI